MTRRTSLAAPFVVVTMGAAFIFACGRFLGLSEETDDPVPIPVPEAGGSVPDAIAFDAPSDSEDVVVESPCTPGSAVACFPSQYCGVDQKCHACAAVNSGCAYSYECCEGGVCTPFADAGRCVPEGQQTCAKNAESCLDGGPPCCVGLGCFSGTCGPCLPEGTPIEQSKDECCSKQVRVNMGEIECK